MPKWENLNMEVRSWVISRVLRLEQTSTTAMIAILKMFNEKSKTLGHQSSALSFKSKVDLLFDLEEIDQTIYNHLLKMMEIRNQFAHNPYATSFCKLDDFNADLNKYLIKHYVSDGTVVDREKQLATAFNNIYRLSVGKLLSIEIEYANGIEKEIMKHINHLVVENMDQIWKKAKAENKKTRIRPIFSYKITDLDRDNDMVYSYFQTSISEFISGELKKLDGDNFKAVFKQKETIEKTVAKIRKRKGQDTTKEE